MQFARVSRDNSTYENIFELKAQMNLGQWFRRCLPLPQLTGLASWEFPLNRGGSPIGSQQKRCSCRVHMEEGPVGKPCAESCLRGKQAWVWLCSGGSGQQIAMMVRNCAARRLQTVSPRGSLWRWAMDTPGSCAGLLHSLHLAVRVIRSQFSPVTTTLPLPSVT